MHKITLNLNVTYLNKILFDVFLLIWAILIDIISIKKNQLLYIWICLLFILNPQYAYINLCKLLIFAINLHRVLISSFQFIQIQIKP